MRVPTAIAALGLALIAAAAFAADPGETANPSPESRSAEGFETGRGAAERRDPALLVPFTSSDAVGETGKERPAGARKHTVVCCAFRIFDARVDLFDDIDRDGYYTYFRVNFDVDTDYSDADVYARLYLRGPIGGWKPFYETAVFSIYGSSGTDDYEVETELVAGYPTGDYDVLIEVYDAWYGDLVVEYGPMDSSVLSYVPLEDVSHDGLLPPPVAFSRGGGGGALSLEIIGLAAIAVWSARRRRHRDDSGSDRPV